MSANEGNSFERFEKANAPKRVSGIDYLHSIYKALNLPADFVVRFARLFWPQFLVVDGKVFISEHFDKGRYEELRQSGHSDSSAQFWINLLEITGLFDDVPAPESLEIAGCLAACWNKKLEMEFADVADRARVIHDEATGEVFVAIGSAD